MPQPKSPSNNKTYKPNPAPVKGDTKDATGWDKSKFGDNRELKEVSKGG